MSDADSIEMEWATVAGPDPRSQAARLWQVNTRGRKVVEMTDSELLVSFKAGKLTARSLVWSEGMPEWTPLADVPVFAELTRKDSVPPASGARPIPEGPEVVAGSRVYASAGSEPPTNPGTNPGVAVYERALATLEFSELEELPPESVDEPTPAFGLPPKAAPTVPRPSPTRDTAPKAEAAREVGTKPGTVVDEAPPVPALPPFPSRQVGSFPTPVSASPLAAAALSAANAERLLQARIASSRLTLPGPDPVLDETPLLLTEADVERASAPGTKVLTSSLPAPKPPAFPTMTYALAKATPLPVGPGALRVSSLAVAPAAQIHAAAAPRPALEYLPPIIVQEKDDDGASMITLPINTKSKAVLSLDTLPREPQFSESTLVLSGRRRARRWVPLGGTIAVGVGAACLASALTVLAVRTRPAAPRVVEKTVFVPSAPTAAAPAPEAPRAAVTAASAPPPAGAEPAVAKRAAGNDSEKAAAGSERAAKSEPVSSAARASHKEDASGLETAQSAPVRRAGFPTNPGF